MAAANVMTLSVNPAKATLGSLYPEACVKILRRSVDLEEADSRKKNTSLFGKVYANLRRGIFRTIISSNIFRAIRRREKRKLMERRFSYRAYELSQMESY